MSTVCRFSTITVKEFSHKCQHGLGRWSMVNKIVSTQFVYDPEVNVIAPRPTDWKFSKVSNSRKAVAVVVSRFSRLSYQWIFDAARSSSYFQGWFEFQTCLASSSVDQRCSAPNNPQVKLTSQSRSSSNFDGCWSHGFLVNQRSNPSLIICIFTELQALDLARITNKPQVEWTLQSSNFDGCWSRRFLAHQSPNCQKN